MRPFPFTFEQASERQYRYYSRYTVWLVSPTGERSYLSYTARKSMTGLQLILSNKVRDPMEREELEKIMSANLDSLSYKRKSGQLILSNDWKVAFGGTILQEASEEKALIAKRQAIRYATGKAPT